MNTPIKLSVIHAFMGLLTFVLFLQTGWYMSVNDIGDLPDAHRMIYRASHIYFLFSGLLNLSIGVQLKISNHKTIKISQYVGSTLLLISPVVFFYGFYQETSLGDINRVFTAYGIFLSFGGTFIHSIAFLMSLTSKYKS